MHKELASQYLTDLADKISRKCFDKCYVANKANIDSGVLFTPVLADKWACRGLGCAILLRFLTRVLCDRGGCVHGPLL